MSLLPVCGTRPAALLGVRASGQAQLFFSGPRGEISVLGGVLYRACSQEDHLNFPWGNKQLAK